MQNEPTTVGTYEKPTLVVYTPSQIRDAIGPAVGGSTGSRSFDDDLFDS